MTREETLAWAKSLKPGDKVIQITRSFSGEFLSIIEVLKVTPSGWVKTANGLTFSYDRYTSGLKCRGTDRRNILPITSELFYKVNRQNTVLKTRKLIEKESQNLGNLTYDRAVKILEFFEKLDGEQNVE